MGGASASSADHEQSTNNIVTADKWDNVVAYTNTIEQFAGTGMTVPGYGFLLNNEMSDFDFAPASPGVPDVNLPAGGKIPRSSMNPTIVLRHGKPAFAVGTPGGATIITTVLQILVNHIDFGMPLERAIAAPRVGNFNTPTSFAEQAFLDTHAAKVLKGRYGQKFGVVTVRCSSVVAQRGSLQAPQPCHTLLGRGTGNQRDVRVAGEERHLGSDVVDELLEGPELVGVQRHASALPGIGRGRRPLSTGADQRRSVN